MKTRNVKKIISSGLGLTGLILFQSMQPATKLNASFLSLETSQTIKTEAFDILKNKCNVCHKTRNPFKVFNINNMNRYALKIENQVFELKRMPKGNKISLSEKEKETLKAWIKSIN